MLKIGYIVPEFPGQTHSFFWREIKRLEEMGVTVKIISTRRPPSGIRSHFWSDGAEAKTTYIQSWKFLARTPLHLLEFLKMSRTDWALILRIFKKSKFSLSDFRNIFVMAIFGAGLARFAKENQFAHMHVHSCANAASITMFASLLSKVPYSLTLHGPLSDYGPHQFQKWAMAKFGIVITKHLQKEVSLILGPSIAAKTVIAPMGVNLDEFYRDEPYQPWSGAGAARLYSVGRLNPCKGHDTLIQAVYLLKERGWDIHLTIAGQDESGGSGYKRVLDDLISRLNLRNQVSLTGAVSEDFIKEGLTKSHVFVLASLHEPLGVAIMEAMALSLPTVATLAGGVPELIEHGKDGVLVPPNDKEALADAIAKILTDEVTAIELSLQTRRKIEEFFHDRISANTLIKNINDFSEAAREDAFSAP